MVRHWSPRSSGVALLGPHVREDDRSGVLLGWSKEFYLDYLVYHLLAFLQQF